jgi:hypothetical protein
MRRFGMWLILLLIVFGLSACTNTPIQVCPDDGVWYCEEMQAQFYMEWKNDFADDEFPATGKLLVNNGEKHCLGTEAIGTVATELIQKLCKVCLLA